MFNAQGLSRLFLHLVMFCLVAATACFAEIGQYTVKEGKADVLRGGKLPAVQIVTGLGAETGDVVRTKRGATVLLELDDRDGSSGSVITINENTRFAILGMWQNRSVRRLPPIAAGRLFLCQAVPSSTSRVASRRQTWLTTVSRTITAGSASSRGMRRRRSRYCVQCGVYRSRQYHHRWGRERAG